MKPYRLPQAIKDAYRERDLIRPRARPYAEVSADLDAVAGMPEAAGPEMQELLTRDRLRLLHYCADVSDEEIDRVLRRHAATLQRMDPAERRWTLVNVTQGRRALAERYLVPEIFEIERAIGGKEMIDDALAVARGEIQQPDRDSQAAWDYDFSLMSSGTESDDGRAISEGIRHALRLQQLGFPYEDVIAAWDRLVPSDPDTSSWLTQHRLSVTRDYQRPDVDMERESERALKVYEGQPIDERGDMLEALREDLEQARHTDPSADLVLGWQLKDQEPIARRAIKSAGGAWFEIYAPEPDPQGGWRCAYQLIGPASTDGYGRGADSFGALTDAIQCVRDLTALKPDPLP